MLTLCVDAAKIFSTCGKRQYAAVITDERNRIVGMGYNGGPSGTKHCEDGGCPRLQEGSKPGSNYDNCIAIHAEQNAFLNSVGDGKSIYVNGPPCYTCAKIIVNSTCSRVVHVIDPNYTYATDQLVTELFRSTGIKQYAITMEQLYASL